MQVNINEDLTEWIMYCAIAKHISPDAFVEYALEEFKKSEIERYRQEVEKALFDEHVVKFLNRARFAYPNIKFKSKISYDEGSEIYIVTHNYQNELQDEEFMGTMGTIMEEELFRNGFYSFGFAYEEE